MKERMEDSQIDKLARKVREGLLILELEGQMFGGKAREEFSSIASFLRDGLAIENTGASANATAFLKTRDPEEFPLDAFVELYDWLGGSLTYDIAEPALSRLSVAYDAMTGLGITIRDTMRFLIKKERRRGRG
jgi:hypothetical protein